MTPYDQRIARVMVRPLAKAGITPNQVTALTMVMALAAAWLFARGDAVSANWAGAVIYCLWTLGRLVRLRRVSAARDG